MIVMLRREASPEQRAEITHALVAAGARGPLHPVHAPAGDLYVVDGSAIGPRARARLSQLAGVERWLEIGTPYQLASRALQPEKTIVRVGSVRIGGPEPVIVAGPCSVESATLIMEAAEAARAAGAHILRGGAYKPRSSPYSFQGLGAEGVELLARAGASVGMPVVTEVMEPALVGPVAEHADMLQVGSRNMQNFPLLRAVGRAGRPVLLKRGFAATIDEWLLAAEYMLLEGNPHIILCERGIRGFDPQTRNVLDLACVPLLGQLTHLPVLVDPSHATGRRDLVVRLGVAAVAAGADGVMVEMHPRPDESISDAGQSIAPAELRELAARAHAVRDAMEAPVIPRGGD
ncbi:MAG TPA: 3-deoxy-7-phosphoheptulonate synthase [Ktedonobacterales bacterium]|jgi:3-deoxy-7-phosphoheptulonate synthase|nr:3-deoxy-7-phosphoheptulonate synthase [Ktedonobacterales bacterium]